VRRGERCNVAEWTQESLEARREELAVKAWNEAQTWSWWEEDRSRVVVFEGVLHG
jgi:hypothetical protein